MESWSAFFRDEYKGEDTALPVPRHPLGHELLGKGNEYPGYVETNVPAPSFPVVPPHPINRRLAFNHVGTFIPPPRPISIYRSRRCNILP